MSRKKKKHPQNVQRTLLILVGSVVTPNARMDVKVDRRIASASKAYGTL